MTHARHGTRRFGEMCGSSRLTEAQAREIRRLRAAGHDIYALGQRFGVAPQTVRRLCLKLQWAHLPGRPIVMDLRKVLTAAQVAEIHRLRAAGMLQREIAARFGISRGYVSAILAGRTRVCDRPPLPPA